MRLQQDEIREKLNNLSQLGPEKFRSRFALGYNAYMRGKRSILKFGNTLFGPGVSLYSLRHWDAQRIVANGDSQDKMSDDLANELYMFLEADTGMDKKSLKFYVLKELFELNADEYNDDQIKELIISTRTLLFHKINPVEEPTPSYSCRK